MSSPLSTSVLEVSRLTAASPPPEPRLIGRRHELESLQAAWTTAVAGATRAVLLAGEPVIGKTRLMHEFLRWAGDTGAATVHSRCYFSGGWVGPEPIRSILRARPVPPLLPLWLSELSQLLPEIREVQPGIPEPARLTEPWHRERFFEALVRALLVEQPLLIAIEDLQWVNPATLT